MANNLAVTGFVTGINISDWMVRSVKFYSENPQTITGKWEINGTIQFLNNASGDALVGDVAIRELADNLDHHKEIKFEQERGLIVM